MCIAGVCFNSSKAPNNPADSIFISPLATTLWLLTHPRTKMGWAILCATQHGVIAELPNFIQMLIEGAVEDGNSFPPSPYSTVLTDLVNQSRNQEHEFPWSSPVLEGLGGLCILSPGRACFQSTWGTPPSWHSRHWGEKGGELRGPRGDKGGGEGSP